MGPGPMGLEISNNYCGVMDAFRGLKLKYAEILV